MARTKPVISSTDSPLARRATANAAIWAGVAVPGQHLAQDHLGLLGGQGAPGQQLGQDARPSAQCEVAKVPSEESRGRSQSTVSPTTGRGRARPWR